MFGVDPEILRPIRCWPSHEDYKVEAKKLAEQFQKNIARYADGMPADVIKKGGPDLSF